MPKLDFFSDYLLIGANLMRVLIVSLCRLNIKTLISKLDFMYISTVE